MQNTNLPSLMNGFITSDWTGVYSGTLRVNGLGWQFIVLQTPFYWDGVSNLLVEICFSNTNYSHGTYVQGTQVSAMEYFLGYSDTLGLACTSYRPPWGSSTRPNACFQILPSVGIISNSNNIPTVYKLSQNYPNPFNPATKINYQIPVKGYVSLKIYDMLGRVVKELVNEIKSQGFYTVDYDASGLSSGIYLYRLECNGYIETKKMVMIK
jgi:hypothetical protein